MTHLGLGTKNRERKSINQKFFILESTSTMPLVRIEMACEANAANENALTVRSFDELDIDVHVVGLPNVNLSRIRLKTRFSRFD